MCSKLLARTGKRVRACSSPQQTTRSFSSAEKLFDERSNPLTYDFHTIALFDVPSYRAHIFRAEIKGVSKEVLQLRGIHGQQLRQVQENGQICHYEWAMEHAKKTQIHQTSLIPLTGPDGEVGGVLSVTKDITDWKSRPTNVLREGTPAHTFSQILITTREDEKREISKALHDEIGSASVMLLALVSLAKQSLQKGSIPQALKNLDLLHQQIQTSMEQLHAIIVSLRPPSLDTEGALRGSLEELLESICQLGRIHYRFECEENWLEKGIGDSVKILLYRVVQEALNNVVKHAHATQVTVSLTRRHARLVLTIKDNGVGFQREKRLSVKHVGLLSMRDSIRSIGGRLTLQTAPGQGTCIRAVCPCIVYEDNQ